MSSQLCRGTPTSGCTLKRGAGQAVEGLGQEAEGKGVCTDGPCPGHCGYMETLGLPPCEAPVLPGTQVPKPPSSKVLLEERAGATTTMLCLPSPKCPHLGRLLDQGR